MDSPSYKAKNILVDYEDLKEDTDYTFTYNPCDKYQHFKSHQRLILFNKDLKEILLYKCFEYSLFPEISKKGRLHLHGTIRIIDKNEFYINVIPYLLSRGTIAITLEKEIKTEKNKYKDWLGYCTKQKSFHQYYSIQTFQSVPIIR